MKDLTMTPSLIWTEWCAQWHSHAPLNWLRFKAHIALHWFSYVLMALLLWVLHLHYQFGIGLTDSLPYRFYVAKRDAAFFAGDYVVYKFSGDYKGYDKANPHQFFVKKIVGVPGDEIYTTTNPDKSKSIWVGGQFAGIAKAKFRRNREGNLEPLQAIADQVIPTGYYYGFANHPDSFDSRYTAQGLIAHSNIVAKVIWAW